MWPPISIGSYSPLLLNEIRNERTHAQNNDEKRNAQLMDQYKLYVEMADRISHRRTIANSYFLSLNSAILGFIGYLMTKEGTDYHSLLSVAGVMLTALWHSIILSYRTLNSVKWRVVQQIEIQLPIQPYHTEWEIMQREKNLKYQPISRVEAAVPWVFLFLYLIMFVKSFPWRIAIF